MDTLLAKDTFTCCGGGDALFEYLHGVGVSAANEWLSLLCDGLLPFQGCCPTS